MARYGKVLLQRLTFQYCDRMGSSRGMREYLDQLLPAFTKQHPNVQITTVQKRNQFPYVKAEYALLPNDTAHLERQLWQQAQEAAQQQPLRTAAKAKQRTQAAGAAAAAAAGPARLNSNVIGVKHLEPEAIKQVVWWLSQSQGRPKTSRIPSKHIVSKQPSIQGAWTASTFPTQQ
ncbi:hypothetical protein OEZ85_008461 [Tetradesmus obliquus]|uniref:Ribosomal protein/NADH dehydrogenase domain-containing protein n=1 Tax=Tetradesmus obliquus TaxID=3088 RepID=A0ABY8TKU5_TETOB|nr:hypothetical protein OEZ85_008461 [Tetradesmus obliquus]